jgi:ABC-2 type transport system permease protein
MRNLIQFTWLETKLYFRNFFSPFFALAFPVMLLLLFGTIWGNVPSQFYGGFGGADVTTATTAGIVIVVNGIMFLPIALASYRSRKILKRLRATPVSPAVLLTAQLIVSLAMTAIGIGLLIVVGALVFGVRGHGNPWEFLAAIGLTMASMSAMGLVVAALAPSERAAEVIGNLLYFPMMFLSGASLPAQLFPEGLRAFTKVLPLTHGVDLIKGVWLGGSFGDYPVAVIVLAGTAVVFTVIAAVTFRWE